MSRARLPLLAGAIGLAALALAALPSRRSHSPPPPAPSGLPLLPNRGALRWFRHRDASPGSGEVSVWVDARGQELRRAPGLALSPDLWLSIEATSEPLPPCPPGHTPFPARTRHRTLLRSSRGDPLEILPLSPPSPALAEELHRPLAALGSLLFFRVERVEDPCAEAPRYLAADRAFRVSPQGVENLYRKDPYDPGEPLRRSAASRMNARLGGARVRPEDLSVTGVLPWFSPEGAGWAARLTAPVSWELSYGGGSERASELLPGAPSPGWAGSLPGVPAAALRHAAGQADMELIGVLDAP